MSFKGSQCEDWRVKQVRTVSCIHCSRLVRFATVTVCLWGAAGVWTHRLTSCVLKLVETTQHSHTARNPHTFARSFLFTGALIHHGKLGIEERQWRGAGQNYFVWEGAEWHNIQNPSSHLSQTLSHLPRLRREEILALRPQRQNPRHEEGDVERWRICAGCYSHPITSTHPHCLPELIRCIQHLFMFCSSSGPPARSWLPRVCRTTAPWTLALCTKNTAKLSSCSSSACGVMWRRGGRSSRARTRPVSAASVAQTTGKPGARSKT